jgi:isoleucyl-tRNA synthetase
VEITIAYTNQFEANPAVAYNSSANQFLVIWTTTPWTIPANLAIALHPDFTYVAVDVREKFISAEEWKA